jgi:DNA (cytosine-5)-methyltransferase 1
MITVGSLFAGIGGLDLGLERAGMQVAWQVEIDDYATKVLEKHWPDVQRFRDIRDCGKHNLPAVDLICGGFPCQPFSLAGKKRGQKDDRYLWPEMLRVIKAYRPAWVLGENVAGIVGVELDKVLADLENEGYDLQPFVIPACAVDAPHERKRVWIIARRRPAYVDDSEGRGCGLSFSPHVRAVEGNVNTPADASQAVAHAALMRMEGVGESRFGQPGGLVEEIVFDGCCQELRAAQWEPEPDVGRLADGVSNRVAQLRALGNAVVPQVVEEIGRCIIESERTGTICAGRAAAEHYGRFRNSKQQPQAKTGEVGFEM